VVDEKSAEDPARKIEINDGKVTLNPFAVAVISW